MYGFFVLRHHILVLPCFGDRGSRRSRCHLHGKIGGGKPWGSGTFLPFQGSVFWIEGPLFRTSRIGVLDLRWGRTAYFQTNHTLSISAAKTFGGRVSSGVIVCKQKNYDASPPRSSGYFHALPLGPFRLGLMRGRT